MNCFNEYIDIVKIFLYKFRALNITILQISFAKFTWLFPDFLYSVYFPSLNITNISISGAVITFITFTFGIYALLILKFYLRESNILKTAICSVKPFLKYCSSNFFPLLHLNTSCSSKSSREKNNLSLSSNKSIIICSAVPSHIQALYFESSIILPPCEFQ